MSLGLQAFLAILPIIVAAVLLVGLRWPARWVMPVVYLVAAGINPERKGSPSCRLPSSPGWRLPSRIP